MKDDDDDGDAANGPAGSVPAGDVPALDSLSPSTIDYAIEGSVTKNDGFILGIVLASVIVLALLSNPKQMGYNNTVSDPNFDDTAALLAFVVCCLMLAALITPRTSFA